MEFGPSSAVLDRMLPGAPEINLDGNPVFRQVGGQYPEAREVFESRHFSETGICRTARIRAAQDRAARIRDGQIRAALVRAIQVYAA